MILATYLLDIQITVTLDSSGGIIGTTTTRTRYCFIF